MFFFFLIAFLDDKKKTIDPTVIELDEYSEPEDDKDYIPPSPPPDVISYTASVVETRSVFFSIYSDLHSQESHRVHGGALGDSVCVMLVIKTTQTVNQ